MTPKEKAEELIEIYSNQVAMTIKDQNLVCKVLNNDMAKQCALIAVDEALIALSFIQGQNSSIYEEEDFYKEVKQEIEKL